MPKFKSKTKLPNKPSKLLLLALADLEVIEANLNYKINMRQWHTPGYENPNVCEAYMRVPNGNSIC